MSVALPSPTEQVEVRLRLTHEALALLTHGGHTAVMVELREVEPGIYTMHGRIPSTKAADDFLRYCFDIGPEVHSRYTGGAGERPSIAAERHPVERLDS